jgi:site-specific recombinase XerD
MASFRFELNNKPTKNRTFVILLCVTTGGKRKRLKTSIEVRKKSDFKSDAKAGKWIQTSEPNNKKWNEVLESELEAAKKTYRELREDGLATSDKVISTIRAGERSASFIDYAKQRTKEIYEAGGIRNWKKYNGFCNKLETFQTNERGNLIDLVFAEITPAYLSRFEAHLHTLNNERQPEKKLHPNTIEVNLNIFRTLVKRAIEVEGLMKMEKNPFLTYHYKGVKTNKEKLDEAEINLLKNHSLNKNTLIWHCRNYFLFSYYCAGIRAGDLIQLRWCNISSEGRLHYEMGKNHKERDLILVEEAKEILSHYYVPEAKATDYIFPLLDNNAPYAIAIMQADKDTLPTELKVTLFNQISAKNALINKELKKLALLTGIEKKISFHISRHSFAKVAKQRGTDNSMLKDLLAHSSVKITEGYMGSFDTNETDKALESIFKKKDNPKTELLSLLENLNTEDIQSLIGQLKAKK